jgi:hypothetical protein
VNPIDEDIVDIVLEYCWLVYSLIEHVVSVKATDLGKGNVGSSQRERGIRRTGKNPRVKTFRRLVLPHAPSPRRTSLRCTTFLPPQRGIVSYRWGV